MNSLAGVLAIILASAAPGTAQHVDPVTCPLHAAHTKAVKPSSADAAHAEMEKRGTHAMGFDQSRASHHFTLTADGGRIEIHANSADDATTRGQIATHLKTIARLFRKGDFAIPTETHAGVPDGVAGMKRFREDITYAFEPTAAGGRVVITAQTPMPSVRCTISCGTRSGSTGQATRTPSGGRPSRPETT